MERYMTLLVSGYESNAVVVRHHQMTNVMF